MEENIQVKNEMMQELVMDAVLHELFKMIMHDMVELYPIEIHEQGAPSKESLRVQINRVVKSNVEMEENTHQNNEMMETLQMEVDEVLCEQLKLTLLDLVEHYQIQMYALSVPT